MTIIERMHESVSEVDAGVGALAGLVRAVRELDVAGDDVGRVDQLRLLEELRSVTAAVQAQVTVAFVDSQRQAQLDAGVPAERAERGIASQVGLARRVSPFQARRYVGWVKILTAELPETFTALRDGRVSEWRALLVARETVCLSREDRATVDTELAPRLERLGDRKVVAEAKTLAYRLDPDGYVQRQRAAEQDRRVTLRPAPDTMTKLTALLPVAQGVAVYAALRRAADSCIATGDGRTQSQLMADTLIERTTGQTIADDIPVEITLVMDPATLLDPDNTEPAVLPGIGPVPAPLARELMLRPDRKTPVWLRRLFTQPDTDQLVAMETRRRLFTTNQRRFIALRDQTCRTPWCDAPIRHTDHVIPANEGGATSIRNGQGLCAACNHAKQAPGWQARPGPDAAVDLITPTGHTYRSHPPRPPGRQATLSPVERRLLVELTRHGAA